MSLKSVSQSTPPFIETGLKLYQISNNFEGNKSLLDQLQQGYVGVACWDKNENNFDVLQIHEDVINQSQLLNFLASARNPEDLGELIFLQNESATIQNVITICRWIDRHIYFQAVQTPDKQRHEFDKSFFKSTDYKEVQNLMMCGIFLELHDTDWHVDYSKRIANDEIPNMVIDNFGDSVPKICADILGDMMASCNTPIDLQKMFPDLIGDHALTAQNKYDIIVNDAWIHGDDGVEFLLNKLRQQSGESVLDWNRHNPDRIKMLDELGLKPDAKIEPIKIEGRNDTGIEVGANWWG
jgi:hypothetical protein